MTADCLEFLVTWVSKSDMHLGAEQGSIPSQVFDAQPLPGTVLLHVDLKGVAPALVRDVLLAQPPSVVARMVDGSARSIVAGLDEAGALARADELGLPVLVPGATLTADPSERMLPIDALGRPAHGPADVEYVLVLPQPHLLTEHPAVHGDNPRQALTGPPMPGQVRWVGADGAELGLVRPVIDLLVDKVGGFAGIDELTTSVKEAAPVAGGVVGLWRALAPMEPGEARLITVGDQKNVTSVLALQFPGGVGLLRDTSAGVKAATLPRRPVSLSIAHADVSKKAAALVAGSALTGDRPSRASALTAVTTTDQLSQRLDAVTGRDSLADLESCVVLLNRAMGHLFPHRRLLDADTHVPPKAARTVDDSVLSGRQTSHLLGGVDLAPFTSWDELESRLEQAGTGSRPTTALILVQRNSGVLRKDDVAGRPAVGHALGAHRFANGDVVYFDLQRVPGERVLEGKPALNPAHASAVVLDETGQEVPVAQPRTPSLVDALIDPATDRRYGAIGFEAATSAVVEIRGEGRAMSGGVLYTSPTIMAVLHARRGKWIVELVSKPFNTLDGETAFTDQGEVIKGFHRELNRLQKIRAGVTLAEMVQEDDDLKVGPGAGNYRIAAPHSTQSLDLQYTAGVPIPSLYDLMEHAERHANTELSVAIDLSRQARAFADAITVDYAGHKNEAALKRDFEAMSLRGFLASVYAQVMSEAVRAARGGERDWAKKYLLVASRVAPGDMRRYLPANVQNWLNTNAPKIRSIAQDHALGDEAIHEWFRQTRYKNLLHHKTAFHNRLTLADYLDDALLSRPQGHQPINQLHALGITTHFSELTPRDGLPLAPQELRGYNSPGRIDANKTIRDIGRLEEKVRSLDAAVRALPRHPDPSGGHHPWQVDFDSGESTLGPSQVARVAAIAHQLAQATARAVAADDTYRNIVYVEGGGNSIIGDTGLERAKAVGTVLRQQLPHRLAAFGLETIVKRTQITEISRGRNQTRRLGDTDPRSTKDQRRSVKIWYERNALPTYADERNPWEIPAHTAAGPTHVAVTSYDAPTPQLVAVAAPHVEAAAPTRAARPDRHIVAPPADIKSIEFVINALGSMLKGDRLTFGQAKLVRDAINDTKGDIGSQSTGWLRLPPPVPYGPVDTGLARLFFSGLMPLSAQRPETATNFVELRVPSEHVGRISFGGKPYLVVDLDALADVHAVLDQDGTIAVPKPVSQPGSGDAVAQVQTYLRNLLATNGTVTLDEFLRAIIPLTKPMGATTFEQWAKNHPATWQLTTLAQLERLPPNTVTPVRLGKIGFIAVVGDRPAEIALVDLGGTSTFPLTAETRSGKAELYFHGAGSLAHIDLPRPPVTAQARNMSPAVAKAPATEIYVTADELTVFIADPGRVMPSGIEQPMRRRYSVSGASRQMTTQLKGFLVLARGGSKDERVLGEVAAGFRLWLAHPIHLDTEVIANWSGQLTLSSPTGWSITDPSGRTQLFPAGSGGPVLLDGARLDDLYKRWEEILTGPARAPTTRRAHGKGRAAPDELHYPLGAIVEYLAYDNSSLNQKIHEQNKEFPLLMGTFAVTGVVQGGPEKPRLQDGLNKISPEQLANDRRFWSTDDYEPPILILRLHGERATIESFARSVYQSIPTSSFGERPPRGVVLNGLDPNTNQSRWYVADGPGTQLIPRATLQDAIQYIPNPGPAFDELAAPRRQLLGRVVEAVEAAGLHYTTESLQPMLRSFMAANGLDSGPFEVNDDVVAGFMASLEVTPTPVSAPAPQQPARRRRALPQIPRVPELTGAAVWPVEVSKPVLAQPDPAVEAARTDATVGVREHVSVHPHSHQVTRSAFDVRRYQLDGTWYTEVTTRVSVTDPRLVTPDGGDRVFAALHTGANRLSTNPTNVLPNGDRLVFRVERVQSGTDAHLPAELTPRPTAGPATMNQFRWWPDAPAEAYVHELLHNLGLPDDPVAGNTMGVPTLTSDGRSLDPDSHLAQGALQPRQLHVLDKLVGPPNALGGYHGTETVTISPEQIAAGSDSMSPTGTTAQTHQPLTPRTSDDGFELGTEAEEPATAEPTQPPSWPLRLDDGVKQQSNVYVISSNNAAVSRATVDQLAALADAEHPVVLLGTPRPTRAADRAQDVSSLNHLLEQFAQRGQLPIVVRRGAVDLDLLRVTERYGATVLHQTPQGAGGGLAQLEPSWQATVARADGRTETSADLWPQLDAGVLAAATQMARPTAAVTRVDDALGALIWAPVTDRRQLFHQIRRTWSTQDVTAHRAHVEQMIERVPDQRDLRVFAPALEFSSTEHVDVVFDYADATVEADRPKTLLHAVGRLEAAGHLGTGLDGGLSTANLADMVTAIDGSTDATNVTVSILDMIDDIKDGRFSDANRFITDNRAKITVEQKGQWVDAIATLANDIPQHTTQLEALSAAVLKCPPKEPASS
ncbi:hypothetical protein [Micromonospora sp. NPDC049102]|uniref:hypothetical protein n=1 Tax=Micromonospora sp. NPDC049102 TaxID=3364265 RepID=UPI003719A2B9